MRSSFRPATTPGSRRCPFLDSTAVVCRAPLFAQTSGRHPPCPFREHCRPASARPVRMPGMLGPRFAAQRYALQLDLGPRCQASQQCHHAPYRTERERQQDRWPADERTRCHMPRIIAGCDLNPKTQFARRLFRQIAGAVSVPATGPQFRLPGKGSGVLPPSFGIPRPPRGFAASPRKFRSPLEDRSHPASARYATPRR